MTKNGLSYGAAQWALAMTFDLLLLNFAAHQPKRRQ